jgi:hypothetical protein
MITKRRWIERSHGGRQVLAREGWCLFGFIPLYVRDLDVREYRR